MASKASDSTTTALVKVDLAAYAVMTVDHDQLKEIVAESTGGQAINPGDLERIKIPAGGGLAFELPTLGEPEVEKSFTGVILKMKPGQRAYWPGAYDGANTPPQCSSRDGRCGVGNPGGECATCPFNQYGTAANNTKPGKACKEMEALFILREGSLLPTLLMLPPTSMKAAKQYGLKLLNKQISPLRVVTRFSLEKATSSENIPYSKIVLTPESILDDTAAARVREHAKIMEPLFDAVDTIDAMSSEATTE